MQISLPFWYQLTQLVLEKRPLSECLSVYFSPNFYRAMLCIRGTSHGPVSVCLCLSQVGVLLKRQNVGSHKQHHTIAQGLYFSDTKDLREIRPGSPPTRAPNAGWVVKIGDFRQITGYMSKTVKDRHIVSISRIGSRMCSIEWWHCP